MLPSPATAVLFAALLSSVGSASKSLPEPEEPPLWNGLSLEARLERTEFAVGEEIYVECTLRNVGAAPIHFSGFPQPCDPEVNYVSARDVDGLELPRDWPSCYYCERAPSPPGTWIRPGETLTRRIELTRHFPKWTSDDRWLLPAFPGVVWSEWSLSDPGLYTVHCDFSDSEAPPGYWTGWLRSPPLTIRITHSDDGARDPSTPLPGDPPPEAPPPTPSPTPP